ncbi:MAG: MBL fold metallo-hydrolase [Bacteroidetes bacterium]|nr:MBL fold metallo-hydrolase [Bacteroidota bacterium]
MIISILAALLLAGGALFMTSAPQFGSAPDEESLRRWSALPHYKDGRFVNIGGVDVNFSGGSMLGTLWDFLTVTDTKPAKPLPVAFEEGAVDFPIAAGETRVTWFGHSAVLLEIDGKRILIDPMLNDKASPIPIFGSSRFRLERPLASLRFPRIDAVLISHDHYDHLDLRSIRRLQSQVRHFFVPLGVGAHLRGWGIDASRITEMDWWDTTEFGGITLTAAPAQHFSGRGLTNRNSTLWVSWAIRGASHSVFFSGDSGYGPHFREIGERLGPFDYTMIECGQYNEKWAAIHAMPEESVQAHLDLRGAAMMPIHWSGFQLALHTWTDPVERAAAAATEKGVTLVTPKIGQAVTLGRYDNVGRWWEDLRP